MAKQKDAISIKIADIEEMQGILKALVTWAEWVQQMHGCTPAEQGLLDAIAELQKTDGG